MFQRFKRILLTDHSKIKAAVPLTYKEKSSAFTEKKKKNMA